LTFNKQNGSAVFS